MKEIRSLEEIEERLRQRLPYLRERYGLRRVSVFGSFSRGRPADDSDVDLLVECSKPLGLAFVALAEDLEEILGRRVHLATFESLHQSLDNPRRRRIALEIQRTLSDVCS